MGRFRAEAITIKKIGTLKIIFYDSERIYIKDNKHDWALFHRWGMPRGSYRRSWGRFREALWKGTNLDYIECYRMAFRYEIGSMVGYKPNLADKKVRSWQSLGNLDIHQIMEVLNEDI